MTRRNARDLAAEVGKLSRDVRTLQTSAQLGSSSIEGGSTEIYDDNDQLRQIIGAQPDGTITTVDFNAPPPVQPSQPTVTPGSGTLLVEWDGQTADGSAWLADFDRVEVHLSTVSGFEPTDATEWHAFHTIKGGGVTLTLTGGTTYYVRLVAVNTSQVEGPATAEVSGVPEAVVSQAQLDSIQAEVDSAEAAAASAQTTADAAELAANNITATQITDDAIETRHLTAGLVTAAEIATGAVIAGKIAAGAVEAGTIAAGAVTTAALDALAVTADKLAANAVVAGKIAAGAVEAGNIAAGAVQAGNIAAGAVTAATIAADAIDGKTITGALIRTSAGTSRIEVLDDGDGGAIEAWSFSDQLAPAAINPGQWEDFGPTFNSELALTSGSRYSTSITTQARIRLRGGSPEVLVDGFLRALDGADVVGELFAGKLTLAKGRSLNGLDYGSSSYATDANGVLRITHNLNEVPNSVTVTSSNNGSFRHPTVINKTASYFDVRIENANGVLVTNNANVGLNWLAFTA